MVIPLTRIEGVPPREGLIRGTAHFAGTGPASEVCGGCKYRGYYRESSHKNMYHTNSCLKFKKLTGKHGPIIDRSTPSCKYFEKKQKVLG